MPTTDPIALAETLLAANRPADAVTVITQAAANGVPAAHFQLALWHLIGHPLPRDLVRARAALRNATDGGDVSARVLQATLTANGTGGPADWSAARAMLRRAAGSSPVVDAQLTLLQAMALTDDGTPATAPPIENLTTDGSIRRIRGFLTPQECAHIAQSAAAGLAPATVVDPKTGRNIPNPIRTSDAGVLSPLHEDLVIRAINHRIAAASGTHIEQGEALTILRYSPGQQFRLHADTIAGTRNQRDQTVLIYLNAGYTGGETAFPDHGLTVTPAGGDAILFTNTRADGSPDPRMRHAGLPVVRGVKWLATRWIRRYPFDVWTGPETFRPR